MREPPIRIGRHRDAVCVDPREIHVTFGDVLVELRAENIRNGPRIHRSRLIAEVVDLNNGTRGMGSADEENG